jgi:hypothetical protein
VVGSDLYIGSSGGVPAKSECPLFLYLEMSSSDLAIRYCFFLELTSPAGNWSIKNEFETNRSRTAARLDPELIGLDR